MRNRKSAIGKWKSRSGFAILMVCLVLVGLAIIAAPFALSMRQEEKASIHFAARIRAKLAATAALNWAFSQLESSHEYFESFVSDELAANRGQQNIYNSPYVDSEGEFRVDVRDSDFADMDTANPAGIMWGATVHDEQGKINLKTASKPLLRNLFRQLLADDARADAVADALVAWRDAGRHQFTTVTQIHEVGASISAAEFDRISPFLTVHSASLVGDVPSGSLALHPVNINTCTEEVLRALLFGLKLAPQEGEATPHAGVTLAEVTALIPRLRVFHKLRDKVEKNAGGVDLDSTANLPAQGWVSIEGDAVKYKEIQGNTLVVSTDPLDPPCAKVDEDHPRQTGQTPDQVEVRLLYTDVDNDLQRILDKAVDDKVLGAQSRSAILVNAINPLNTAALDVTTTTAPLCFRSFNIYSIEACGIVSAPDGRELARYTVTEVAQVAPAGELAIKIETQDDFQRSVLGGMAHHVATWPNACQVSDIPPQNIEVPATTQLFRRGRLGLEPAQYSPVAATSFVARYDGPLMQNTLRADTGTHMPDPVDLSGFTTVKVVAGSDGDIDPEGIHVGVHQTEGSDPKKRILVYQARNDTDLGQSNIPHNGEYVSPFIIEMFVKFDPAGTGPGQFNYAEDHFLFDLAEKTFTNRVAIYYDATGTNEGDLVLHLCDATEQPLPAQVRYHITDATFEPQRWYHLAVVVKGIGYNQMALLINGRSVGQYEPSAVLTSNLSIGSTTASCDNLAKYMASRIFARYQWPAADCALIGGELIEHSGAGATDLTGLARGARGTQERNHYQGTRVQIYGYDDRITRRLYDTEYGSDHLLRGGEEPHLVRPLPESLPTAKVDDGDEQAPAPAAPTGKKTADYWNPATDKYQAAELADNTLPAGDWLPIAYSEPWIEPEAPIEGDPLPARPPAQDDETKFAQAAGTQDGGKPTDKLLDGFLAWNVTGKPPLSTSQRVIEDATNGLGFIHVDSNDGGEPGETLKYSKVGVVLVWRWHPEDAALEEARRRRVYWYIGYLGGFGTEDGGGGGAVPGARGCFGTEEKDVKDVMEGASIRLDCILLDRNDTLPRGHRENISWTYTDINGDETNYDMGNLGGRGIFQIFRDQNYFEWVQFTYPQFVPEETETALVGLNWIVGISRASSGTTAHAFVQGTDLIMPVFFGSNSVAVMNNYLPIIKGPGDRVTLTDLTHQREEHYVNYGSGHYFAFRTQVGGDYYYAKEPRILKFPSGNLPMKPDKLMYIGSDAVCQDGDKDKPFTEGGEDTSAVSSPTEPERPANATFDEIKIYPAGGYATVGLYDYYEGHAEPRTDKDGRWELFSDTADATPLRSGSDLPTPFYIRIGHLERISPKGPVPTPENPNPPFQQPFRFVSNGQASWPVEGYLKIDDECVFYRTLYYNRQGSHSAKMLFQPGKPPDPDGLTYALQKTDTEIYIDFDQGKDFPEQGYISFSSGWPSKNYWDRFTQVATDSGQGMDALWAWLGLGNFILDEKYQRISSSGGISNQERLFYNKKEKATVNGQEAWKLTIQYRAILDSELAVAKYVDEDSPPAWYSSLPTAAKSPGGASVSVFPCELLVLRRGCLGTGNTTQQTNHAVGTIVMPLEHIPTSLAPRPMVKLQRNLETGKLLRDPEDDSLILALADDDTNFDITKPEYEYGLVVEDRDSFPDEGYVQVGDEILGYVQERSNPAQPSSSRLWKAKVLMWDEAQSTWVQKIMPILTGIKHFRQRYGTARSKYLEYKPGDTNALKHVDPGVPDPAKTPGDAAYQIQPTPPYWQDADKHIVHAREFRYHDRYPQVEPATADLDKPTDYVGQYAPHATDSDLGYYEFAVTLPGALWTRVQWSEALYRKQGSDWTLTTHPLAANDPFDVKVLVQIDGAPGWSDMTLDKVANPTAPKPVSTPVYWRLFPDRVDAYDPDSGSHHPLKPVLCLFDEAFDPVDQLGNRPPNYINPYRSGSSLHARGQYGDRIRLRVLFQYRNSDFKAPDYDVPWRTPWVDTIYLNYRGPTYVMEHKEMPY